MKNLKRFIMVFIIIQLCGLFTACNINKNEENDNVIYTEFGDKLYFKGVLYSRYLSFTNTTFNFPILSKEKINTIENVELYDGDYKIDANTTIEINNSDDKKINEELFLNIFTLKLNIQNVDGINISRMSMTADGKDISYDVDIKLHSYYLNSEYNIRNEIEGLDTFDDTTLTFDYGYGAVLTVSKLINLESMLDGIEIKELYIADSTSRTDESGWKFQAIANDGSNILAYKKNLLRIKADYTKIKEDTIFFKDAFKANILVGDEQIELFLPDTESNLLIGFYASICEGLQL